MPSNHRISRRDALRLAGAAGPVLLGGAQFRPLTAAALAQTAGDALTVMTGTEIETLDPHRTGTRNTQIATEAIYSGLVKRNTDNTIAGDLATDWEVSDDGLVWTFALLPDALFSDGTPVDAAAVVFMLERIMDPATASPYLNRTALVAGAEAVDPTTVRITTKEPFSPLVTVLSDPGFRVVQPAAVAEWGEDYGQHPVGSGAYMVQEWRVGDALILVPNPNYYGDPPANNQVTMRFAREGGARAAALEGGQVNLTTNLPPEAIERVEAREDLAVLVAPSSFLIFFVLDHTRPPFDDVRVRQAANLAVDRQTIVDRVLGGLGAVANSPVGTGVLNRAEFTPWPFDPERAKALLAEAGYPDGVDIDMWAPEGRYLKDRQVGEAVQGYMQSAGFRPSLQVKEWGTYNVEIDADPMQTHMYLIGASIPDAYNNLINNFGSNADYPNGYANPRVDELLTAAAAEFDEAAAMEIYTEIQRIVFDEDTVMLFLHGQRQVLGHKAGLTGLEPLPFEIFYLDRLGLA